MLKNYLIIFSARYLIYILFLTLPLFWIKKNKALALKILVSASLAFLAATAMKYFFNIERPFVTENLTPLIPPPKDASFPSQHTAVSSAFAVSVLLEEKILGMVTVAIAILIGTARVLALVHYPVDIFAGFVIGTAAAYTVHHLLTLRKG